MRKQFAVPGGSPMPLDRAKMQKSLTFVKGRSVNDPNDPVSRKILQTTASGTSIFDPALCEILYAWFCPPGGTVLDPFAGGSVRGIVAATLGRRYVGMDLRTEQIEENREQWADIEANRETPGSKPWERISISVPWMHHKFLCSPEYITSVCRGRCCEGTDGVVVSLLPEEAAAHSDAGHGVMGGLLQPDKNTGKCPHKRQSGLCAMHGTDGKPFGCIASPFTLNRGNTLIVRHRYTKLRCHGSGAPAYETFRTSLDLIFGAEEAARICNALSSGATNITARMPEKSYRALLYLDAVKHGSASVDTIGAPEWHAGDSRTIDAVCASVRADFVFSCPPYADLEVYSDDPADISTMPYAEFLAAYREIIAKSCALLADDRFACFVVGEARGRDGNYYGLVPDTISAFRDAGLGYYNELILVTAAGSLPLRAGQQFARTRKVGKTHQNVLVFCKGDARRATEAIGPVAVPEIPAPDDEENTPCHPSS